jgi:hypothetical protein
MTNKFSEAVNGRGGKTGAAGLLGLILAIGLIFSGCPAEEPEPELKTFTVKYEASSEIPIRKITITNESDAFQSFTDLNVTSWERTITKRNIGPYDSFYVSIGASGNANATGAITVRIYVNNNLIASRTASTLNAANDSGSGQVVFATTNAMINYDGRDQL